MSKTLYKPGFDDAVKQFQAINLALGNPETSKNTNRSASGIGPLYDGGGEQEAAVDSDEVLGLVQVVPGQWAPYFQIGGEVNPPPRCLPTQNGVIWGTSTNGYDSFANMADVIDGFLASGIDGPGGYQAVMDANERRPMDAQTAGSPTGF